MFAVIILTSEELTPPFPPGLSTRIVTRMQSSTKNIVSVRRACYVCIFFLVDMYPRITYFPLTELVVPTDEINGNLIGKVKIPCKANGKKPLKYTWTITSSNYKKKVEQIDNGLMEVHLPVTSEGYMVMCYVINDYGAVFSDNRHVDVIGKNKQTNKRMNERRNEQTNEQTNRQTHK